MIMKTEREKISYRIGERIRRFRTKQHLSQEALALSCEIHPAYLGRLERGEKCPTVDTLYRIAQGLKIPLSELLDVTAEINPTHKTAIDRIENAIYSLSESEAVEIAEIIERLIAFKRDNA